MAGFIAVVIGLVAVIVFVVAGAPLALRIIASDSAFGLRSADTDGDSQIWHLANAAIGRDLLLTAGIDLILMIIAVIYWGEQDVQSALVVAILIISVAGTVLAISRGLTTARALGKAKQAFPAGSRRF